MITHTFVENIFDVRLTRWRHTRQDGSQFWERDDGTYWDEDPRNPSSKQIEISEADKKAIAKNAA